MGNSVDDREQERERYDRRAARYVSQEKPETIKEADVPLLLRLPYTEYRSKIVEKLKISTRCLDLCAGMGEQSGVLLESGKDVTVTDISEISLQALLIRYGSKNMINAVCCNMEKLPFACETFDLVTCAGGLSYGDNDLVMHEILRVLKPGGHFICVDSLNNNPIYRINRLMHYVRRSRSKSTLARMPSIKLIKKYNEAFGEISCSYFGKFTWLCMVLSWFSGDRIAAWCSDQLDRNVKLNWLAFKFVMTAKKTKHD